MMRYLSMLFLIFFISGVANAKENNSLPEWMVGEWTMKGIFIEENSIDLFSPNYIPYKYDKNTTFVADYYKFRLAERGCSKFSIKKSSVYMYNYLKDPPRETDIFVDSEGVELPKKIKTAKVIKIKITCTENLAGGKNDLKLEVSPELNFPMNWEFVKLGKDIGIKDRPCPGCFFIFQRVTGEKTS